MSDPELTPESGPLDRLVFFSDAVVAIAITLLALDLPVPEGDTLSKFWGSVRHGGPDYLAFLVSFAVIAASWSQHHDVFRYAERSDSRLRAYNMLWLFTIVLFPFATHLLTTNKHADLDVHALRFGFYSLVEVLNSVFFILMVHHLMARQLEAAGTPARVANQALRRSYGTVVGFALSIPLFFVISWAWICWFLGPSAVAQIARRRRRRG